MNLKLPTFKKPKGGDTAESKAPKFLSDLYRDLSDRHLLLPVIGLLVAIVAVPMLLSSDSEPSLPATAPPTTDLGDASALDAAVIVSDPGIRDYRKRLTALQEKNPFESPGGSGGSDGNSGTATTIVAGSEGSGSADSSTAPTSPTGSSTSSSSSTGSTSSGSVSVDIGSDTGTDTTTPPTGTDTTDPGDADTEPPKPQTRFYASRVDVTIGPVGNTKTIEGVKALDFLPNQKTPVVAYLGLVDQNHALFSVNPGVVETQGEGDCAPRGNSCMYLTLKIGKEQRFVYGDENDAEIYRLKLLETHIVRIPDPLEGSADGDDGKQTHHAPIDARSR